jgi:hypothetical protein
MIRIFVDLVLLISVFLLPPYVTLIFVLIGILFFKGYVESIFFGFLLDLIYGGGSLFHFYMFYFFTLLIFIFYIVSIQLKKVLRLSL